MTPKTKKSDPELGEKKSKWNPFHKEKDKDKRKSQEVEPTVNVTAPTPGPNGPNNTRLDRDSGYGETMYSEPSTAMNSLSSQGPLNSVSSQGTGVSPYSGGPAVSQESHYDQQSGQTITTTVTTTTTTITTTGPAGTHTYAMPNGQAPNTSTVQTIQQGLHTPQPSPGANQTPQPQQQQNYFPPQPSNQTHLQPQQQIPQNQPAQKNVQFLHPDPVAGRSVTPQRPEPQSHPSEAPSEVFSPVTPPVPTRSAQRHSREPSGDVNPRDFSYFPGPQAASGLQQVPQARTPQPRPAENNSDILNNPRNFIGPQPPSQESQPQRQDSYNPNIPNRMTSHSGPVRDSFQEERDTVPPLRHEQREYAPSAMEQRDYVPPPREQQGYAPPPRNEQRDYAPPPTIRETGTPNSPSRQNFSYPGRSVPIPPQEMPADEVKPLRVEPGSKPRNTYQNLKSAAIGLHGVGETLRGTLNNTVDKRWDPKNEELARHNQEVIERGRLEMEQRRLARSHAERDATLSPNTTAARFHTMMHHERSPQPGAPGGPPTELGTSETGVNTSTGGGLIGDGLKSLSGKIPFSVPRKGLR